MKIKQLCQHTARNLLVEINLLPNLISRLAVSKHVHIHRLTVDKYYLGGIIFGRFF